MRLRSSPFLYSALGSVHDPDHDVVLRQFSGGRRIHRGNPSLSFEEKERTLKKESIVSLPCRMNPKL